MIEPGSLAKRNCFDLQQKGIPLETFEDMTIGKIRDLDKQYKKFIRKNK